MEEGRVVDPATGCRRLELSSDGNFCAVCPVEGSGYLGRVSGRVRAASAAVCLVRYCGFLIPRRYLTLPSLRLTLHSLQALCFARLV